MRHDISVPAGPASNRERVSDRVFHVLGMMQRMGPGPHSLNAIINSTSLSRSTVQRIIQSGLRTGVMLQARHGHYALTLTKEPPPVPARQTALRAGFRTAVPADGRAGGNTSSAAIHQELGALRGRLRHTVSLHAAILVGVPAQTCVERLHGPQGSPPETTPGVVRSLDADPAGLSILAHLEASSGSTAYQHIRSRGFSLGPGPAPDWLMIAAPLIQSGIPIGAMSIIGRRRKLEQDIPVVIAALKATRTRLSHLMFQPS